MAKLREFLDRRVANAVSQLLHGEKNGQQIDQDEVDAEMHQPAEKTRVDKEPEKADL